MTIKKQLEKLGYYVEEVRDRTTGLFMGITVFSDGKKVHSGECCTIEQCVRLIESKKMGVKNGKA